MAMRGGSMAPLLIVIILIVRSVTGTSFEAFSLESMLFLVIAMAVPKRGIEAPTVETVPGG
jgi:hypothetical protein